MVVRDRVTEIIEAGIECGHSPQIIADKVLLYIQQSIVDRFQPGKWRDTLYKSDTDHIINHLNGG